MGLKICQLGKPSWMARYELCMHFFLCDIIILINRRRVNVSIYNKQRCILAIYIKHNIIATYVVNCISHVVGIYDLLVEGFNGHRPATVQR